VVQTEHPQAGAVRMAGLPVKLSATPGAVRSAAPLLGEHTAAVLAQAGYPDAQIAAMLAAGSAGAPAQDINDREGTAP